MWKKWRHLSPGVIILRRLLPKCKNRNRLLEHLPPECRMELDEQLSHDCKMTYADGIMYYLKYCKGKSEPRITGSLPEQTKKVLERALNMLTASRLRPMKYIVDSELVHIVADAGCGIITLTVAPDSTIVVSGAEGANAEIVNGKIVVICREKPSYLRLVDYMFG